MLLQFFCSVAVRFDTVSLAGGTGKRISAMLPPPCQGHRNMHGRRQLRAGKWNLRPVVPWVKGVAGRRAVPSAELVLLPLWPLPHSLTGHFSRLLVSVR